MTTAYNSGALPCYCDSDGSLSYVCDPYGGQCQCRPNVIGRRCDACKTGYFGFPDCKSCNCPSAATCETTTGECICPPRVIGKNCDQCESMTYGFDPIIGCEDCKCNYFGVDNGNLQCDLFNGSCQYVVYMFIFLITIIDNIRYFWLIQLLFVLILDRLFFCIHFSTTI